MCDFLLVINGNGHPISYRFEVITYCCLNFGHCVLELSEGGGRDWNPGFEKPGPRGNPAILPNPKPGFKSSGNPGFGFVFFGCLKLLSVHFYIRSCNSLMRFTLVIIHKLSKCLLLLFLQQTDSKQTLFSTYGLYLWSREWRDPTVVTDWHDCSALLSIISQAEVYNVHQ